MLKSIIVLPDGTRLSSGPNETNPIMKVTLTEEVNAGDELALGSACAAILEANILAPYGGLTLAAGDKVTLYKVDEAGVEHKKGVFILEKPSRVSANAVKLTGYDRMIELDKDLTTWLSELDEWPYSLHEFAGMVCDACGLSLVMEGIPNADFPVPQFKYPDVTGRQLMKWIGEICGCFCRANADGNIELAWYAPSGKTITPSGDYRYFAKGLSYETYTVDPIEAVQLKLADSEDGALWPAAAEGAHSYVISGNPILLADVSDELEPYLDVIRQRLAALRYTPCKVSLPANLAINAGSTVEIIDSNGDSLSACVMRKVSTGQKDTLQCTGSRRRDSAPAVNSKSTEEKVRQMRIALKSIDGDRVVALINLSEDGIKIQADKVDIEGKVNAEFINALNVTAAKLLVKDSSGATLFFAGDKKVQIGGWNADSKSLYSGTSFSTAECFVCTGSAGSMSIGGSGSLSGWMIKAGNNFGVTKAGALYAADAHISGEVTSSKVNITGGLLSIPLQSWNGKTIVGTAVMDYRGVGCSNLNGDSGFASFMTPTGIMWRSYNSGDYAISLSEDNKYPKFTLVGTWYIGSLGSAVQVTSDRNAKMEIQDQESVYSQIFDQLKPVIFRYKNGTSGRIHTGFIAQDVEAAVLSAGLTTKDFAAVCYDLDESGNKVNYGVRYEEIVSLNTYEIQKLKQRVADLEANKAI